MRVTTQRAFLIGAARLAIAYLVLSCTMSCETDQDYAQKLANVRQDCNGHEVVGIWVSKLKTLGPISQRITLLLRPDGTGRMTVQYPTPLGSRHSRFDLTWQYKGAGLWKGLAEGDGGDYYYDARYDGSALMFLFTPKNGVFGGAFGFKADVVFVPADNEAAVAEHLNNR